MIEPGTATPDRISLPLLLEGEAVAAAPEWQGWSAVHLDAPEPLTPQGAYSEAPDVELSIPLVLDDTKYPVELLAPAGGPDAAFAAFHFGADAIYLGLKKFSARAEAENFTLDEVDEITAYAHSLTPRRRVFITINTVIRQDELPELIEDVAALADIGVDALIIQDLGVYHLVKSHFPDLELHASTQLAVHNRAGAEALKGMGFHRVVLARELTFEEVRDITATSGIETEVFIHGALCYSYSGLCLFSSQTLGRSGNRGKCSYSCRDSFEVSGAPLTLKDGTPVKRDPSQGFPFSMKDLALPDHMPALRSAGVSCFKVEGRKKSPLYVATTTDYYRRLLDGTLEEAERPEHEADMQTVFSRPWTHLFVQSHKDKEVADRDTVGHRGTLIGHVEAVLGDAREQRLRFRTERDLERHDGLQIDLPILGKPYGFPVDHLWIVQRGKRQEVFEAVAGSVVEVGLPGDHPQLPPGAPVYCSSSQDVKQKYRHERPKPGLHRTRRPLTLDVVLTAAELRVTGLLLPRRRGEPIVEQTVTASGTFEPARDPASMAQAIRTTFEKLGDTHLELESLNFRNESGCFVPVSRLNAVRRDLVAQLQAARSEQNEQRVKRLKAELIPADRTAPQSKAFRWSIKVDRLEYLDALEASDWHDVDEVLIDIARDHATTLPERVEVLAQRIGRERIRFALPPLTRAWEDPALRYKIAQLLAAGWQRWEAANLSSWNYLGLDPATTTSSLDLSTDWSVYVLNRLAAQQVLAMGVTRFALSPEDGLSNVRSLLSEFASQAVLIVHQDTPLFLAESCAYANLIGGCPGKANCKFESMEMVSSAGEKATAIDYHCRTIVLNDGPFCLSTRLADLGRAGAIHLRADFIYKHYDAKDVRQRWRLVRAGKPVPGGHAANFDRGLQ